MNNEWYKESYQREGMGHTIHCKYFTNNITMEWTYSSIKGETVSPSPSSVSGSGVEEALHPSEAEELPNHHGVDEVPLQEEIKVCYY